MKGCEAYNALCGSNSTVVEQCLSAGPIPDHVLTFTVKDGIDVSAGSLRMSRNAFIFLSRHRTNMRCLTNAGWLQMMLIHGLQCQRD
jgi:hypothetical protein